MEVAGIKNWLNTVIEIIKTLASMLEISQKELKSTYLIFYHNYNKSDRENQLQCRLLIKAGELLGVLK